MSPLDVETFDALWKKIHSSLLWLEFLQLTMT